MTFIQRTNDFHSADDEIAKLTDARDAWERGFAERGKRIAELERENAALRAALKQIGHSRKGSNE